MITAIVEVPPRIPVQCPAGPPPAVYTAACGCVGTVLAVHTGRYPSTDVKVTVPCRGHPHRIGAGVVEHFIPAAVTRPTPTVVQPTPPKEITTVTAHRVFEAAEHLAPKPTIRAEATAECWARHYAALAFAAFTALHDAERSLRVGNVGNVEISHSAAVADAALAAAVAFTGLARHRIGAEVAEELWDLTPELGALNGEWEEWLVEALDRWGINPADIDGRYVAADFNSPAVLADLETHA